MANIKIEELSSTEVDNQVTDLTEGELSITGGTGHPYSCGCDLVSVGVGVGVGVGVNVGDIGVGVAVGVGVGVS